MARKGKGRAKITGCDPNYRGTANPTMAAAMRELARSNAAVPRPGKKGLDRRSRANTRRKAIAAQFD